LSPASEASPYQTIPPGSVVSERAANDEFRADIEAARPTYLLFKMTWHPNWRALIDGAPAPTVMLSPGFIGVHVPAGRHTVVLRYQGSAWKLWPALLGPIAVVVSRRRWT
jgi:hypothetical protein